MKVLIIGQHGMLGSDMMLHLARAGHEVHGIDHPAIDITDEPNVRGHLQTIKPEAIINCAAYTAVDACETNADIAFAVNDAGCGNLARCTAEIGAALVHFSTDYVFDGTKPLPYLETDEPNPQSVYGKSKLAGERRIIESCPRHFILRISWLYGIGGNNFVKTIRGVAAKNASTGTPLRVVNDQRGTPTWTVDVCRQTIKLMETEAYGLYHATNEGSCSWFDFAKRIVEDAGIAASVQPCSSGEYPRPAPRPANSVLENERLKRLGANIMQSWESAWQQFLAAEKS